MAQSTGNPSGSIVSRSVRCRWLSGDDEQRFPTAAVVRLVVDDRLRYADDLVRQLGVLREVSAFVDPKRSVLFTPAGMTTCTTPNAADSGIELWLRDLDRQLNGVGFGGNSAEMLLGVDGCAPGSSLQTVVHVAGGRTRVSLKNTAVKFHPAPGEWGTLVGWRLVQDSGVVPAELLSARLARTSKGTVSVLVCHDACLFSARSGAKLKNPLSLLVRDGLRSLATAHPRFTLVATHYQGTSRSGGTFKDAANRLADETGSTVVTTMFAPKAELSARAEQFPSRGPEADRVVTLLVSSGR